VPTKIFGNEMDEEEGFALKISERVLFRLLFQLLLRIECCFGFSKLVSSAKCVVVQTV